jgi:hypothetical protein
MKRLFALAALALVLQASLAQAQLTISGGCRHPCNRSGNEPPPLGPWYNYWPLEAHFQVPAMPEYPYYSPPQTLPQPFMQGGYGGGGMAHMPYGGGHAMGAPYHPGMASYAARVPYPPQSATPPSAPAAPANTARATYPAQGTYPGYGYPAYGYGYGYGYAPTARPLVAPPPTNWGAQ